MYFYESHLGGLFTSQKHYSYKELYCDECGDSDEFLGEYESWEDFIEHMGQWDYCIDLQYLADMSGLSVERILELNPKLADDEETNEEEE